MRSVDLAWTLAARIKDQGSRIKDHIDTPERNLIYVTLGSGDTDSAIRELISIAVRERVLMPRNVIDALLDWNSAHDDMDAKLSVVISSIPIQPEPRGAKAPKKAEYLTVSGDYRRCDPKQPADGSA
jgi:hypothetical protein